jgi:hypothetical protein
MRNRNGRAILVAITALVAIGEATDTGPMILGGSASEAVVGRPMTPVSYAGVARRTTRRTVATSAAYSAPPAAYVTALPAGCVMAGGVYTCGAARYAPYYNGPTVVYRPL